MPTLKLGRLTGSETHPSELDPNQSEAGCHQGQSAAQGEEFKQDGSVVRTQLTAVLAEHYRRSERCGVLELSWDRLKTDRDLTSTL